MKTIWLSALVSLITLFPSFAQFADDFSDGNFTSNPVWVGDADKFIVETGILRLNDNVAGQSYLATTNNQALNVQWDFWVRIAFSPSNSNHPRIYLVSDQQNLRGPLNGYFLQIGRDGADNKRLFLMRQTGTTTVQLLAGSQNLASLSNNLIRIRVTRDAAGNWAVWADERGGSLFLLQGQATDLTHAATSWFGVVCLYTVTNSRNFFFDDFIIGPIIADTEPPTVNLIEVVSSNQVNVHFSEVVELNTAQNIANYTVNRSIGSPITATRNATRPNIVNLFFAQPLETNVIYEMQVRNIMDQANNMMGLFTGNFVNYVARRFDVLFNEIMANPVPAIGLPGVEYIELYNNTPFLINLEGWILQHGTTRRTLSRAILEPGGYLVLAAEGAVASLRAFTPHVAGVPGLSSTALTNAGTSLMLFAPGEQLISFVEYSDRWYRNPAKSNGGWSLEKIDRTNLCSGADNWIAAANILGGTPGSENSVSASNPDVGRPELMRIGFVNPNTVRLFFSESMSEQSLLAIRLATNMGLGNIVDVRPVLPLFAIADLILETPMQAGRIYQVTLPDDLMDCAGNRIANRTGRVAIPDSGEAMDVVINEVLFNPPSQGARYIELFNRSGKVLDLRNHVISSKDNVLGWLTSIQDLSSESFLFFPGDYVVISNNPDAVMATYSTRGPAGSFIRIGTMPSMTNTSGVLVFASKALREIDLFEYNERMHFPLLTTYKGVALERVNPNLPSQQASNWHSAAQSVGFGTPGLRNSQFKPEQSLTTGEITVEPLVFSPDHDGHNDLLQIAYQFEENGYIATVRIFNSKGALIRNLVAAELLGISGAFTWDGTTEDRQRAPLGIYLIHLEITNLQGVVKSYRKSVVLGGSL